MRSILLTSNEDIINGLRLAGVRSVKCNDRAELLKNFRTFTKTEDIGIIILTYSSFKEIKDEVFWLDVRFSFWKRRNYSRNLVQTL